MTKEVLSPRAKRIAYPMMAFGVVAFSTFIVHVCLIGGSAFPAGGSFDNGKYFIPSHGKIIELSAAQFWFNYIHGAIAVVTIVSIILLRIIFGATGDIREEP